MRRSRKCKYCSEKLREVAAYSDTDELMECISCGAMHHFRATRYWDSKPKFIQFWFDTIEHWSTGVDQYWACRIDCGATPEGVRFA